MHGNETSQHRSFPRLSYRISVGALEQLPSGALPEVAIAGRSNAGKSSALNAIAGQKALARTSKTPGRTQQLVVFDASCGARLVDLPGYGYAKVSRQVRSNWQQLIERYLQTRIPLVGLLVVMDVRHPFKDADEQLLSWCAATELKAHVLLTKTDKLKRSAQNTTIREVERRLREVHPGASAQLFSSATRLGVAAARIVLLDWWKIG